MKIAEYRANVLARIEAKTEAERAKLPADEERIEGFLYEIAIDFELIFNLLTAAGATADDMSERFYKSVQYSLTKNFKAICLQKKALNESKVRSEGRKDAVAFCKIVCKEEYFSLKKKER